MYGIFQLKIAESKTILENSTEPLVASIVCCKLWTTMENILNYEAHCDVWFSLWGKCQKEIDGDGLLEHECSGQGLDVQGHNMF